MHKGVIDSGDKDGYSMRCQICNDESGEFYCASCIKASPHLLLSLKFGLIDIQNENKTLNQRIDRILENAMVNKQGNVTDLALGKLTVEEDTNDNVLRSTMMKVNSLKLKRRNGRIKSQLDHINRALTSKREYISKLLQMLENAKDVRTVSHSIPTVVERKQEREKWLKKIDQMEILVEKRQQYHLRLLNQWFAISKRESAGLPFAISFQPVISLKNVNKLSYRLVKSSVFKMFQYLSLISMILEIKIPYCMKDNVSSFNDDYQLRDIIIFTEDFVKKQSTNWLTKIIIDITCICQCTDVLPSDQNIDILTLLDQYDIDGVFYHMVQKRTITCNTLANPPTFQEVYRIVQQLNEHT